MTELETTLNQNTEAETENNQSGIRQGLSTPSDSEFRVLSQRVNNRIKYGLEKTKKTLEKTLYSAVEGFKDTLSSNS